MGRAERTTLQQMKSLLQCSDLTIWSVFRPPRYIEAPVKNCARFWAPRRCSHGPPSPEALVHGLVQRLAQSFRFSASGAPNPFHGIFRSRIERSRPPTNGNQYAVDRAVANFGIPSKPADRHIGF